MSAESSLDVMPLEVLERIFSHLSAEETYGSVRLVCRRFQEAAYSLIRREFLAVRPLLGSQLAIVKEELEGLQVTLDSFQREMVLVARFTFLQVLHSEYQILSTIFLQSDSNAHSAVIFKAVRSIREFYDLLENSSISEVNRKTNISTVIDKLRTLNTAVCDDYFWNNWNISKNPFGPLFMKLICCAVCSKYEISVCHESIPKFRNSKCHLHGFHEIPDSSNNLSPLPSGSRDIEQCTRILALYLCDSIRWSNVFYTIRLRWTCMDRALVLGRQSVPSWPLISPNESYLNSNKHIVSETETDLWSNHKRLCRVIKKEGETTTNRNWLGIRFITVIRSEFRLWSPISDIPEEMLKHGEHSEYSRLPEGTDTSRPYLFKLMLKVSVKARRIHSIDGIEETVIWFEETPERFMYTQSKQQVNL